MGPNVVKLIVRRRPGADAASLRTQLVPEDHIVVRDDDFEITMPIRIKHRGGEKVIEGADGRSASTNAHLDPVLLKALAQAYQWREALSTGSAKSLEEVAKRNGCNESHVRHRIGLAFIAPDIVEMIFAGTQPRNLTLDRLLKAEMPLSWRAQRLMLGLAAV